MGDIEIIEGDCLEILPTLAGIDAVVTDPPYGINVCNRSDGGTASVTSGSKVYGRQDWDRHPADPRVIKSILALDVPTVIWGGNYFGLPRTSCVLVWDKMQRNFSFADCEVAWTNLDKASRIFSYSRGQLVAEGKVHPTQKPKSLIRWCISLMGLNEGSTILDPYMGSGSVAVAAMQSGHKFIGIEIDPAYCHLARRRVRDAETPLFRQGTTTEGATP